ncbi:hypothetical protein FNH08_12865 [Streptomyces spongiae]|uniref:Uncharacterized protein n=1 Tax=Streptomyces spongiae TaxID=565072 RepID=A0A5N8XG37_9ACTN|nr:hypothetical protein [Streptomyces spongiae]
MTTAPQPGSTCPSHRHEGGLEVSGRIRAVGEGVEGLRPGQECRRFVLGRVRLRGPGPPRG